MISILIMKLKVRMIQSEMIQVQSAIPAPYTSFYQYMRQTLIRRSISRYNLHRWQLQRLQTLNLETFLDYNNPQGESLEDGSNPLLYISLLLVRQFIQLYLLVHVFTIAPRLAFPLTPFVWLIVARFGTSSVVPSRLACTFKL